MLPRQLVFCRMLVLFYIFDLMDCWLTCFLGELNTFANRGIKKLLFNLRLTEKLFEKIASSAEKFLNNGLSDNAKKPISTPTL